MRLPLRFWDRDAPPAEGPGRAPLPLVGETVRLHAADESQVGVYHARVRALGPRRILLESLETAPFPQSASDGDGEDGAEDAPLAPRTPLTLSFLRDDALYQCETRVIGHLGAGRAGVLAVARPRVVTRVQRRQFYRLPLQSPTTFRVRGETHFTDPQPARLVNLSGGGALLSSTKPVPGGLRVRVRVPTGTAGDLLDVDADCLDCRVASQGRARVYLLRLRFPGPPLLSEEERDDIVAYIFEQQRMLLKTRKLLR